MRRWQIPLIVALLGIAIGLLSASEDWPTPTRLLVTAGVALVVVLVGTPLALLRRQKAGLAEPVAGEAHLAAYELRGVFSENPVSPRGEGRPDELASALRSPASALLPVVPRGWKGLEDLAPPEEAIERTIFVRDKARGVVRSDELPEDLVLWPLKPRKRPLRWWVRRGTLQLSSVERLREDRNLDIPDPATKQVYDSTTTSLDPATI
jgi:hypothetical protein